MTIKKLGLSAIAATVLASSAFAGGTLNYAGVAGNGEYKISTEYISATQELANINVANLTFTTNFDVVGSGTISDPAFVYTFSSDVSDEFNGDEVIIDTDTNLIVAKLSSISANGTEITFEGDSNINVYNHRSYAIVDASGPGSSLVGETITTPTVTTVNALITTNIANEEISVDLYSTSGTEQLRDSASIKPFSTKGQFKIVCNTKLDGMINYENSSLSFVPTGHGIDVMSSGVAHDGTNPVFTTLSGIDGISDVNTDALIFTVQNNIDADIDLGLDGEDSIITLTAENGLGLANLASDSSFINVGTGNTAGTVTTPNASTVRIDFGTTIPQGSTRYAASIVTDHSAGLVATKWIGNATMGDSSVIADNIANPAIDYTVNMPVGEWMDYTYIGQIAGATSDKNVQTKFFIANRSCDNAVAPTFKLIKDGVVTEVVSNVTIAKDTQAVFDLADIIAQAGSLSDGQYAVEIVLPGLAEDFYIYAQAKNVNLGQFKDLPVYNTSSRN